MTIKPLFDKVVVEGLKAEEKTKSGLYLTSASRKTRNLRGYCRWSRRRCRRQRSKNAG